MAIHYMLAQDAQSAATIRERFASLHVGGVKVGTFEGLLDMLLEYWLLPSPVDHWDKVLTHAALKMQDAFWSKSIVTDEKSVVEELGDSLQLLLGTLPLERSRLLEIEEEEARYLRYYRDLVKLHESMGGIFPPAQTKARSWMAHRNEAPLSEIVLYADDALHLEPWQHELVETLVLASGDLKDTTYQKHYEELFSRSGAGETEDLAYLQHTLLAPTPQAQPPSREHLQWLVARDALQEVEVFAGMVTQVIEEGGRLDEIAVLIPKNGWYKDFLVQTCRTYRIPLSRAGETEAYADLGTQWIFDALQAQERFTPPMVFASLLASPLMPYSTVNGQHLAAVAMENGWRDDDGEIKSSILERLDEKSKPIVMEVLAWQEGEKAESPAQLLEVLKTLGKMFRIDEKMRLHRAMFDAQIEALETYLESFPKAAMEDLLKQVRPRTLQESAEKKGYLNAIHVLYEGELFLDSVEHLFVLGFNDGHYPHKIGKAGLFTHTQWESLGERLGMTLSIQERLYRWGKERFLRQLQSVRKSITFMASALDLQGTPLAPSGTLSDMAYCFFYQDKELEPEKLLIYLEEEREIPFFFATADEATEKERRGFLKEDLHFAQNLLALRTNADGTLKPESPSSLEKLMVSPLGWFFYRRGLEAKTWGVQELDVATQGTIAHGVFEVCFCPENPGYALRHIESKVDEQIEVYAPFLMQAHRRLEYEQLKSQIITAAESFKALLDHCGATVLHAEKRLTGEIFGVPVAGRTDAILDFYGRTLVLDYKKSSKTSRVKRMKQGYDHQLFLYREMLDAPQALTAYYTMNDQTLILDETVHCPKHLEIEIEEIEEACTVNAQAVLEERLEALQQGDIVLNIDEDAKIWDERGVTAKYALETSPLISLFMKVAEEEGDDETD